MKHSPENEKLIQMLKNQKLTPGGFFGTDNRELEDIIIADAEIVAKSGKDYQQIASRMQEITDKCSNGLGTEVQISENAIAWEDESKGNIVCPWPHPGRFAKRTTTLRRTDLNKEIHWSDLNIHLIAEHGFFEGKGNHYRLEPQELIDMLWE